MENAHALVVGIASYEHIARLPETVLQDARDIREVLIDPSRGGYLKDNVTLLPEREATLEGLRGALKALAAACDADSTALIYISSHGARSSAGTGQEEYLLPIDADPRTDASLAASAISGEELSTALRAIPARKLLVLFDCCHAGGIGQPKSADATALTAGLSNALYARLQAGQGRVIIASSEESESSYVMTGARNSLFTEHVLAGLGGGVATEDSLIRVFDLFEYVQPRVTGAQRRQHPVFKADLRENFPIAMYLGGEKGVVQKTEDGYRYDAFISYSDREPDTTWVWDTLLPKLTEAGVRVAISGDSYDPGVPRLVSYARGIEQSRRTVVVYSEAYEADHAADFDGIMAMTRVATTGVYSLIPVRIDATEQPLSYGALTSLNLVHPRRAERELQRLIEALKSPL